MRRVLVSFAVSMAAIALALSGALPGRALGQFNKEPNANADQPPSQDAKETRLSLQDIRTLRGTHTPTDKVVEIAAEQGRDFEVTAEVESDLRKMGFSPLQVAAIKDASPDPLAPGKWLSSTDAERDAMMELMRKVAAKGGAAIQPVASGHVTLWAAKGDQETYLADLRKAEKFFHTKCAEPIRSGLDKRTAHVVLLSNRAEYEAWWRAMLELDKKLFEVDDEPGFGEQIRRDVFKFPVYYTNRFSVITTGEMKSPEWTRRSVAFSVGYQYVAQLSNRSGGTLQAGFSNLTETFVCGSPAYFGADPVYHQELQPGVSVLEDWGLLVKQRLSAGKASSPADLLKVDKITSSLPLDAERWSLVGLLNQQPVKFGKLLADKDGDSNLAAIEKIYGWNEKELSRQWRVYVMNLRRMKAQVKRN